ncbi:MAG: 16S rRNA (guanine(966)-N(2))-methyltransferase RsmD [Carboxydocellales bacterium]
MRVITGSARGRKLKTPKGLITRPTTDRVKEALFNILGNRVLGAKVLDLFAGSGALAIEALSRGAEGAVLVEVSPQAILAIQDNLTVTKLSPRVELIRQDVYQVLANLGSKTESFDLIFLDPPYHQGHGPKVLELIARHKLLTKFGLVVIEASKKESFPLEVGTLVLGRRENYGDSSLVLYTWQ